MRGLFITIEGVEGCGKTTQVNRLKTYLEARGSCVVLTREPGWASPLGLAIRDVLLNPKNKGMSPLTELLLFAAARAEHVEEKIRPALDAGAVVVCDRFADSTTAYQGAGRGIPPEVVETVHRVATAGVWPDLTIVLDVPAPEGLQRARRLRDKPVQGDLVEGFKKRPRRSWRQRDRIEQESLEFHERVRTEFLRLAECEPGRVKVVDGLQSEEAVAKEIQCLVDAALERLKAEPDRR